MLQVEAAQTCFHGGFAVGRGPGCAQPAIGARSKAQGALALFFEREFVIDEVTFTAAPFRRFVLVDPGPDGVHGCDLGAARLLDCEEPLPPGGIKPVPRWTP